VRNGGREDGGWPRWSESNARETVLETVLVPNLSGRTSEHRARGVLRYQPFAVLRIVALAIAAVEDSKQPVLVRADLDLIGALTG